MKKSRYNEIAFYEKEQKYILYNFYTDKFLELSEAEKQDFEAFPEKTISDVYYKRLEQGGFITDQDELAELKKQTEKGLDTVRSVTLVLCPTMDCNFGCPYCIEAKQKWHGVMSEAVQDSVVEFAKQMLVETGNKALKIVWYGGEPLLAINVIENISRKLLRMCSEQEIQYNASIITNGYLLNTANMLKLACCSISFIRVTLDGPARTHDQSRTLLGGEPTYAEIMSNLYCLFTDRHIQIRCNLSRSNIDAADELIAEVDKLRKATGNNISIRFARMMVSRDVPRYLQQEALTEAEFGDFILTVKEEASLNNPYKGGVACAGVSKCNYVIDSLGDIYKCNAFIGKMKHKLANVLQAPTHMELFKHTEACALREKAFPILEQCLQCKLLPRCMGSCPLDDGIYTPKRCDRYRLHTKELVLRIIKKYKEGV